MSKIELSKEVFEEIKDKAKELNLLCEKHNIPSILTVVSSWELTTDGREAIEHLLYLTVRHPEESSDAPKGVPQRFLLLNLIAALNSLNDTEIEMLGALTVDMINSNPKLAEAVSRSFVQQMEQGLAALGSTNETKH